MDWTSLIGPAVVAAAVSGIVTVIGFVANRSTSLTMHRQKLQLDRELAERKFNADIALAERKLDLDRQLADWKRRTELAELALADFYKAQDIFAAARQPMAFGGDGETRPDRERDDEMTKRYNDSLYAPFERLAKERDFFSEMQARRFRFIALFGNEAADAFQTFVRSYNRVHIAVGALISDRQQLAPAMRTKFEGMIGWALDEDDEIKLEIDQAVSTMEAICRPVLRMRPE